MRVLYELSYSQSIDLCVVSSAFYGTILLLAKEEQAEIEEEEKEEETVHLRMQHQQLRSKRRNRNERNVCFEPCFEAAAAGIELAAIA